MPAISLVVCVYKERDLLERLLLESEGCFDDLVVVHDGPEDGSREGCDRKPAPIDYFAGDNEAFLQGGYQVPDGCPPPDSIQALVQKYGGRFYVGGRSFQQEPHWPFAWSQARHDWILRLDADEFPSPKLKDWLQAFRRREEPPGISGYTCLWPLWDGSRAVTQHWPGGREFLFHRRRVRFFGMVEQVPIGDGAFESLPLVLEHQPRRKSYGVRNIVFRRQAFHWRRVIAESLMRAPTDLPRWRWNSEAWPQEWERLRRHPLRHSATTLVRYPLRQLRELLRAGERPILSACLNPGLHHGMLGLRVFAEKWGRKNPGL